MKIKNFFKKLNYRHYICIAITMIFIATAFIFPYFIPRLIESFRDFGLSVSYYFCKIFHIDSGKSPTVTEISSTPITLPSGFPADWISFKAEWGKYWQLFISRQNIIGYIRTIIIFFEVIVKVVIFLLPIFLLFYVKNIPLSSTKQKKNADVRAGGEEPDEKPSIFLKAFLFVMSRITRPVIAWIKELYSFIRKHKAYWIIWLMLWLGYFNAYTIVIEFIAFYLYFVMSFDILNIFVQLYKLFSDLSVVINFIPGFVWIIIGLIVFDMFRKSIAYKRLERFEMRNRGFINERPIVFMLCGSMGTRKTTLITDMALSQEVMYREVAKKMLLDNDLKFPHFPWRKFEEELHRAIEAHEIYNLATARRFVRNLANKFEKEPCRENIFGYDFKRYGLEYDDKLKLENIWKVIETYAQLYYIYSMTTSLIISNYSIRSDLVLDQTGDFPEWDTDVLHRDSRNIVEQSEYSKILDFDACRPGKKMIKNNPNANFFEFGILNITEIGKERGNALELSDIKKQSKEVNQKNDLFNSFLKMIRHSSTIDNHSFVRVIVDEQRPESWGADARDLCDLIYIDSGAEPRLAMPFFNLEELLYSFIVKKFSDVYYEYRSSTYNTLSLYLFKSIVTKFNNYYKRIHNLFDFIPVTLFIEDGRQDGDREKGKYYLISKKIYSERFSTDCFSGVLEEKTLKSGVGLSDMPSYNGKKATVEEMMKVHSYFFNDFVALNTDENKGEK